MYERLVRKLKNELEMAEAIAFTSDLWTSSVNNAAFLSFTGHWIPEMNVSASPSHVIPQTSSTQYNILEPRVQPRFERSVTPQNQMNVIEGAYWNATQN